MGHSERKLRHLLNEATTSDYTDYDSVPVKSIIAIQGGGSWSIAAAEAVKILVPHLLKAGSIEAVSGTSGGAANAALVVKALNQNMGSEGVKENLDTFWNKVRQLGTYFNIPRSLQPPFAGPEDRWPNIPQGYIALAEAFRSINPLVQMALPTANIRDLMDNAIGDWSVVQNGPTAIYTNTVQRNLFSGKEQYLVASGKDVDADAIASSAGLDELGGHIKMSEFFSPQHWLSGNINRYRDGAYRFNPDLGIMLDKHPATDVIVIALHGSKAAPKSAREEKLYTDHIYRDLASMLLDDGRRVNFHVIQIDLPGNASSRLNTDPEYLDLLRKLGRDQTEAQLGELMAALGTHSSYRPQADLVRDMVEKREIAL